MAFVALIVFVFSFMTVFFNGPALAGQAKTTILQGVVEDVDGQYVVKSKKGTVAVTGQDFSEMQGKTVQVTGKMTKGPDGEVFKVSTIKDVKKIKSGHGGTVPLGVDLRSFNRLSDRLAPANVRFFSVADELLYFQREHLSAPFGCNYLLDSL